MTRVPFVLLSSGALLAAIGSATLPAFAQTDPNQPINDGSAAASQTVPPGNVAPGKDPGTTSANSRVDSSIRSTKVIDAANKAQYDSDLAAYDSAMRAHGRAVARQDARYARQQQAFKVQPLSAKCMEVPRPRPAVMRVQTHLNATCNLCPGLLGMHWSHGYASTALPSVTEARFRCR